MRTGALARRQLFQPEARQRQVDRARKVAAGEFVRLAHVDDDDGLVAHRLYELVVADLARRRVRVGFGEEFVKTWLASYSWLAEAALAASNWVKAPSAWLAYIAEGPAPI